MPCSVREATPNDEQQIRALLSLVIHESLDASVHNISSILNNVNDNVDLWRAAPDNIVHLVAETDGKLVGVIMIKGVNNTSRTPPVGSTAMKLCLD